MMINQNLLPKTAVFLLILLFFTACTITEARPTNIPTIPTAPPEVGTVTPTTIAPTGLAPTRTPTQALPTPTAVPPRYIEPTPTLQPVFPPLPVENSVTFTVQNQYGGVPQAVLIDGQIAYLAVGPRLVIVDVSDPTAPRFINQSPILGDVLQDIAQLDNLIFGAAGRAGLVVLDVSDPTNIQLVNDGPNYSGAEQPNAFQIAISGGRAFVVNNSAASHTSYDLLWFELSNPTEPAFLDSMPLRNHEGFSEAGGHLFIATEAGIQVVDPQDPTQELSRVGAEQEIHLLETAVHNNLLYLLYAGQGVHFTIYDLSDPAKPQVVPQSLPVSLDFIRETTVTDNIMAITSTYGEFGFCGTTFTILDITQAEAPQKTSELDPQNCVTDIVGYGNLLYITGLSGLQIFSTTDPANLQLLGSYTNPGGFHLVEDFLPGQPTSYILTGEGRGSIITEVELNPDNIAHIGQTNALPGNPLLELLALGKTLVAPVWNQELRTFALDNHGQLQSLFAPTEDDAGVSIMHTTITVDNVVYMPVQDQSNFSGGLGVFNLEDPTNPQLVENLDIQLYSLHQFVHSGSYLYILGQAEQTAVAVINISDPFAQHW